MEQILIFLSHADTDRDTARDIAERLERYHYDVFLASREGDIECGAEWENVLKEQIEKCDLFFVLLSANFKHADHTDQEVGFAIHSGKRIYSFAIDETKPYGFMAKYQGSKLNIKDMDNEVKRIYELFQHAIPRSRIPIGTGDSKTSDTNSALENITKVSEGTNETILKTIQDHEIDRSEIVADVLRKLKDLDRIVVTGDAGSGKSVLLAQIYDALKDNHAVLFLRGDDYLGIKTIDGLLQRILESASIRSLIDGFGSENKLVVILDSLDAISRNETSIEVFKELLKNIWGTKVVKTVCSVRTYDYEHSHSISKSNWGHQYELNLLTDEQLDMILEKISGLDVPSHLRQILKNPLHLRLYSSILKREPHVDHDSLSSEIALYDEHWHICVEDSDDSGSMQDALYLAADTMAKKQRISVPEYALSNCDLSEALRQGILRRDNYGQIIFFHHAYLDYVISRNIIAKHDRLVEFLLHDQYKVFLRPSVVFALAILNRQDPKYFVSSLQEILKSDLKFFWKMSALTAMSKISSNADSSVFYPLGEILTKHSELQYSFLVAASEETNPFWFNMWKESFLIDWASSSKSASVVAYASSIMGTKELHPYVFKILQAAVQSDNPGSRRRAVEAASKLEIEEKFPWLLGLSSSGDWHISMGILNAMPDLLDSTHQYIPDIFANMYDPKDASDQNTGSVNDDKFSTSNIPRHTDQMIIWNATTEFPKFLEKSPSAMIKSAIKIFERSEKDTLAKPGSIVDDDGALWYTESRRERLLDKYKLLHDIEQYLKSADVGKLEELTPLLADIRLATWRSIRLSALGMHHERFRPAIYKELCTPEMYRFYSLRKTVREALHKVAPVLTVEQIGNLICIMKDELGFTGTNKTKNFANRVLAEFLSEIPKEILDDDSLGLLKEYDGCDLSYKSVVNSIKNEPATPTVKKESTIKDELDRISSRDLKHHEKIDILNVAYKYLRDDIKNPNTDHFKKIRSFLLQNVNDPDPEKGEEVDGDHVVTHYDTVRGLVAKCMICLLHHIGDQSLMKPIEVLSDDPISLVRADVADVLDVMFWHNRNAAYNILKKYARDPARRVRMYLLSSLAPFEDEMSEEVAAVVEDLLIESNRANSNDGVGSHVVYLALWKKVPSAISLLNRMTKGHEFSEVIRSAIPFTLKGYHLFPKEQLDASLEIFYDLLTDPSPKVRKQTALIVLYALDDVSDANMKEFAGKISYHIEQIANEINRSPADPRIIELLVWFLEKHWKLISTETTLGYLKSIATDNVLNMAYNPVFASGVVDILSDMDTSSLDPAERDACIDILDPLAKSGWDDAISLLNSMERHD